MLLIPRKVGLGQGSRDLSENRKHPPPHSHKCEWKEWDLSPRFIHVESPTPPMVTVILKFLPQAVVTARPGHAK